MLRRNFRRSKGSIKRMSMEPENNETRVSEELTEQVETAAAETEAADAQAAPAPAKRRADVPAILMIVIGIAILGAIIFSLVRDMAGVGPYALKVNDTEYSAAEVNYEYMSVFQQYSQYSMYFGSVLPDDPYTMEEDSEYKTWGDFYMAQTKEKLQQLTKLCDLAARDGVVLEDEDTAELDAWIDQIKASAASTGEDDFDAFLADNFGEGVNEQVLRDMGSREILAMKYVQHYQDNLTFSDEEIAAAYEADKDTYDTYRFSYCLVGATQDASVAPDDAAMDAAKAKAEDLAAKAKSQPLEDAVGDDPDVQVSSTAMDGNSLTQYQVPFESWLKDPARAEGDIEVFEQEGFGWFVIVFEGRERDTSPTVNVRHILIQAEDADGDGKSTDAELAAAKAEIERIKAEYDAGEQTEDAFAELANRYSTDPGSNTNGGLYENVYEGQMVPEFNEFCFDPARKAGDVEIISDEQYNGWHLMYFVGTGESYTDQVIREKLASDKLQAFADSLTEDVTVIEGKDIGLVGLSESFLNSLKEANTPSESVIPDEPDPNATLEPVTESEPEAEPETAQEP